MSDNHFKGIILDSLKFLTKKDHISLYAYVIMPNHIHFIWNEKQYFERESGFSSFFKYTSHKFKQRLLNISPETLKTFRVDKTDREYQFWMRNRLDVLVLSDSMFDQKLEYIHDNPVQPKYQLADRPVDYQYSSANFYENGVDEIGILTNYYLD